MAIVTLREFTDRIDVYVDRAHAGAIISIIHDGRPWARLVPESSRTGSDYLDQLLAGGQVTAPTADFSDYVVLPAAGTWNGEDATAVVSEQRGERPPTREWMGCCP
jgi:antitoxin (DNA-binding transcriptional repressor) of toxin-antitoxin stability system